MAPLKNHKTRTTYSRRGVIGGGVAVASAAMLGASWSARRSFAAQVSGDISVRFFPFGTGVEDLYAEFKDEFEAQNPDVKVNLDLQPWDNRYPKMLADIAAGQGPDVMFVTTDVLIRFSQADAIVPLDFLLPAELWSGYEQKYIDEVSLDGSKWYLPFDKEVPLWLINKDIYEQSGLDPAVLPANWDDLRGVCETVKSAGDDMIFGWGYQAAAGTLNTTFYPFLVQAGGRPISEDGTTATFNSPEGVEALTFITELFTNGWASQQYMQPIQDGQDPFILGTQAVSLEIFVNGLKTQKAQAPELNYALTPMLGHKQQAGFGGMRSWAISKESKNPEAAAALVNFLSNPEINRRHCEMFGTFPAGTEALAASYQGDTEMAEIATHLEFTFGEQKHKYGRDLMPLVIPEIQAAIIGEKTPQQALDDAASAVNELFAQG
ncbi:MAG: ABC transporter substrate-binding protein [Thermomicrobiales bacterium]